jgi:hypothetical protein
VIPPIGPVKIQRNWLFSPFHSSIASVRSNRAGNHSEKYFRGGPGTFQRARGDGVPGNRKGSPAVEGLFQAGRTNLDAWANAGVDSIAA